jgi:hypothetical protein
MLRSKLPVKGEGDYRSAVFASGGRKNYGRVTSLNSSMNRGAFLVLLILQCLVIFARADLSTQELQQLVNGSTVTFIGTVKQMGSNVSGFDQFKDFPVIVEVESVESSNDAQALRKFGDLRGNRLTVSVNPISRIVMKNEISAVFFADPLVYEKYIGVVATAVPLPDSKDSKEDFLNKLHQAALERSETPLRVEVKGAELIIVGEVVAVRPVPRGNATGVASVKNSWEFRSEHRPRWAEAIIKVQQPVLKPPGAKVDFVAVVFPHALDCFSKDSPKFEKTEKGIWLLYQNNQLAEAEKSVLLKSDKYEGRDIQSYTALRPIDFQDISRLAKIQQIIAEPK